MKKRILSLLLAVIMTVYMLPATAFAYLGAIRPVADNMTQIGKSVWQGQEYLYLTNPYISFAVLKDCSMGIFGFYSATAPTVSLEGKIDDIWNYTNAQHVFLVSEGRQDGNDAAPNQARGVAIRSLVSEQKKDKDGNDIIQQKLTFEDNRFTATIEYRLVRLNSGAHSGVITDESIKVDDTEKTQNWGVYSTITFTANQNVTSGYFKPYMLTSMALSGMGHPNVGDEDVPVYLDYVRENRDGAPRYAFENYTFTRTIVANETPMTYVGDKHGKEANGNTYSVQATEIYTDGFTWANPFVALSSFHSYSSSLDAGVENFPFTPFPDCCSYWYGGITTYTASDIIGGYPESTSPDNVMDSIPEVTAASLWGMRDLYKKGDSFTKSDDVSISQTAGMVGIYKKGTGYQALSAENDAGLTTLENLYGKPIAVIRGENKREGANYIFTDGAAALTPTVTATWDKSGGSFSISTDGTIRQKGISLNAPSFKFYKSDGDGLTLNWSDTGLEMNIDPAKNKAIVYVDIAYAKTELKKATADMAGNLIFEGNIGFDTVFDGAQFSLEKLGYGLKGEEFKVNGIKANGSIRAATMFNMELASIKGEINTFAGEEKYSFSLSLNTFDLFTAAAELTLMRCKDTGVLMPDSLWFEMEINGDAGVGIPLVPPTPVAEITGGGAGFKGLADTVNGDYFAIPPIMLRGAVIGEFLKLVEARGDIALGPGGVDFTASDVHIVGTPEGSDFIDKFQFKFGIEGQQRNYQNVAYKGITVSGSEAMSIVLPSKSLDIIKVSGGIAIGAFGGLNADKTNLYLQMGANGKISGDIQIPSSVKIIGGKSLMGAQIDAIIGGQTVVPVQGVTAAQAAKKAFDNIDVYLGVAATSTIAGSDFRVWVIVPDVVKDSTRGTYWDYDYKIFGSLPDWNWSNAGLNPFSLRSLSQGVQPMRAMFALTAQPAATTADITMDSNISEGENAYLALAFDESVTEEQLKGVLKIKNTTTNSDVDLIWLNTDANGTITNGESANVISDIADKQGENHRLVLACVGGDTVKGQTFHVDAGSYAFTYETAKTQSLDSLDVSFDDANSAITGEVKHSVVGKSYTLRTYLGTEKGGSDYLIDEQTLSDPSAIRVSVPANGTLAPTGTYYVSTFLMENKIGDFNGDGKYETALMAIDDAMFNTVDYTNTNEPNAPASVTLDATGNEVMQAAWTKVDGADGYKITVYQQENGKWVDSGFGYELNIDASGKLPTGLSLDSNTYKFDMALTVGGTGTNGSGQNLAADKDYKIGVQARKTIDEYKYYSGTTQSNEKNLPAYAPLAMTISVNGAEQTPDSTSGIYTAYINRDSAFLSVSATNESATFKVKRMDTMGELAESNGSYLIPTVDGSLMLEIVGSVTNGGTTDTTTRFVLVQKDDTAPILTLSAAAYYADAGTGNYTVTGTTEPGATVTLGLMQTPTTTQAGADGSFALNGQMDVKSIGAMLSVSATDTAGNMSNPAYATVAVQPNGSGNGGLKYNIISGENSDWIQGENNGLTVTCSGEFSKFTGITVDSNVVPPFYIDAKEGSTIVTIKPEYLKTLSVGTHQLRFNYTDGYAQTTFTIKAGQNGSPQTGDSTDKILLVSLLFVSGGTLTAAAAIRKRKRKMM